MGFADKKIKDWTNGDVVEWVSSIGLPQAQLTKAVEGIKESECTGKDWFGAIKGKKDVQSSFGVKSAITANKIFKAYKKRKQQAAIKAAQSVGDISTERKEDKEDKEGFQLNLFGQSKYR
eukprot:809359_1